MSGGSQDTLTINQQLDYIDELVVQLELMVASLGDEEYAEDLGAARRAAQARRVFLLLSPKARRPSAH